MGSKPPPRAPNADGNSPVPRMLRGVERACAAGVAVIAAVLAGLLEFSPPSITQVSNSAACVTPTKAACTVAVSGDVSPVVVALVALAAAGTLIALLGIRFTKLSAAGATLSTEDDVSPSNPNEAKQATGKDLLPSKTLVEESSDVQPGEAFAQLPDWAQRSLISWANKQTAVTTPLSYAVIDSAKEKGQGNKAWYVTVSQDSGDPMILRVATGRGGTSIGEHETE